MRTFDFLYNANGEIDAGKEIVYYPTDNWYAEPRIVTIAGYDPYYTDDSPDPKNADECWEWCQIEVYGNPYESQIPLRDLYELKKYDGEANLLYNGWEVEIIGTFEYIEGEIKCIFKFNNDIKVEDLVLLEERCKLTDLSDEKLKWFYEHCAHCSMYYSDYQNDVGIEIHEASNIGEMWCNYVDDEDIKDTFENFKEWVGYCDYL